MCTAIEVPQFIQNKTHYIVKVMTCDYILLITLYVIQEASVLTPESARHVHHMLLYLCDGIDLTGDPAVGVSQECNGISVKLQACRTSALIAGWAVGGNVSIIFIAAII